MTSDPGFVAPAQPLEFEGAVEPTDAISNKSRRGLPAHFLDILFGNREGNGLFETKPAVAISIAVWSLILVED
jgi:hypothetical protein